MNKCLQMYKHHKEFQMFAVQGVCVRESCWHRERAKLNSIQIYNYEDKMTQKEFQ